MMKGEKIMKKNVKSFLNVVILILIFITFSYMETKLPWFTELAIAIVISAISNLLSLFILMLTLSSQITVESMRYGRILLLSVISMSISILFIEVFMKSI